MSTTRIGVVIDALISTWTASGVTVADGQPLRSAEVAHDVVYVGWDGTDGAVAATADQAWAGISSGQSKRDEAMEITCYAEATRGAGARAARDGALALIASCETSLRSDPTLGVLAQPGYAQFGAVRSLTQPLTASGSRCGVVFTVVVTARI